MVQLLIWDPLKTGKSLSQLQQIRNSGPAKLSVTLFGTLAASGSGDSCVGKNPEREIGDGDMGISPEERSVHGSMEEPGESAIERVGWPPKVAPQSGPAYSPLSGQEKSDLRKLHANLGHPSPDKLARVLTEQGARHEIIQAAGDYQCDVCIENQPKPRLPTPSSIHSPKDFNDCVGGDGVTWTNRQGRKFHFMHFSLMRQLCFILAPHVDELFVYRLKFLKQFGYNGLVHVICCILILPVNAKICMACISPAGRDSFVCSGRGESLANRQG